MNDNKKTEVSTVLPVSETQKVSQLKSYSSPILTEWGTLADLTQGGGTPPFSDTANSGNHNGPVGR